MKKTILKFKLSTGFLLLIMVLLIGAISEDAFAQKKSKKKTEKPNVLVIWGDDIGISNVSAYHRGLLGGSTPNIDRLGTEGALFTDMYAEQSCTAGRSSFILGAAPFQNGTNQSWFTRS